MGLLAACGGDTSDAPTIGPTGRDYFGVAWLESGIVVNYEPDQSNLSNDLWRLSARAAQRANWRDSEPIRYGAISAASSAAQSRRCSDRGLASWGSG